VEVGSGWVKIFPLLVGWVGSHKMDPWTTLDFNRGKEGHERQGRKTTRRVRRDHRPPPATVPQPAPLAYEWQFSSVNTSPPVAVAQYCDERVCLSVCLSVRVSISGTTRPSDLHQFLCMLLWSWLGPPLVALRYVMYFRFHA